MLCCVSQESAVTTAVEHTLNAADKAANQLPSNSPVHNAATSVLDVMEEIVAPEQALQKRVKRKQEKARFGLSSSHSTTSTVQQYEHILMSLKLSHAPCDAGNRPFTSYQP